MNKEKPKYTVRILSQFEFDIYDDNIDVEVRFESGERYIPTFFTVRNIQSLMDKNKVTGENSNGKYIWAADMVIVETLTDDVIRATIDDLIETGDFFSAFAGPYKDEDGG